MKKYLKLFTVLIVFNFNFTLTSNVNAKSYGEGELNLSPKLVEWFIDYVRGGHDKSPSAFYITIDGSTGASSWYCPMGSGNCQSGSPSQDLLACERYWNQECKMFAKKRTIVWRNGINKGKGKDSRINTKWTNQEIKSRLKELGF